MKKSLSLAAVVSAVLFSIAVNVSAADNLVLSEFMADNTRTLVDEDGQYSDWIEIYNAGTTTVNLDGWYLTDNAGNLIKWRFPATNLPPYGYLVVFASNKNRTNGPMLHTNFRLDAGGEFLALVRPGGTNIATQYSPQYPGLAPDQTYGLAMIPGQYATLVSTGSTARVLIPASDIGTGWTAPGFDDAAWLSGVSGVGFDAGTNYASFINMGIGTQMLDINSSAYLRFPFTVADPNQLQELAMNLRYDDGFIAYLNGTEVARGNAPTNATWNSAAPGNHGSEPGLTAALLADFDTNTPNFTLAQQGTAPGASIQNAGSGSTGKFFRLITDAVNGQVNGVAFDRVAPGVFPAITADFDFRISSAGDPADGFAFLLLPTSTYGTNGQGVAPIMGTGSAEEPNYPGIFAVGFDLYEHASRNDVSIHWNGVELNNITIPRSTIELVSGAFHRCSLTIEYVSGGAYVTVVISPNVNSGGGAAFTAINRQLVAIPQYECRVQFVGRTGGLDMSVDLDNVNVRFLYPSGLVAAEGYRLDQWIPLLQPGNNVLAIHGLNVQATNKDFFISPELTARSITLQANPPVNLAAPTPRALNQPGAEFMAQRPQFSQPGGVFASDLNIELTTPAVGAVIRYSLDGSLPTEQSPQYAGPLAITNSVLLTARVWLPGFLPSDPASQSYTLLDAGAAAFSSGLPVIVIDTFGRAINQDMDPRVTANFTVVDAPKPNGRATLMGIADYHGRIGIEGRGQTSWGFAKKPYNVEIRDEFDQDQKVSLLGFPAESDWILGNPYNDKTLMNDFLAYELYEKMGHYSVRRRFVEVFLNGTRPDGSADPSGKVGTNDYVGVYLFLERIKVSPVRVDIAKLQPDENTEPDINGGYMWKKDKASPGDTIFTTTSGQQLRYHDPKPQDLTATQRNWLLNHLNQFEGALYSPNWLLATGTNHYSWYMDADSFVDQHWLVEFTKQIDGYRLSNYMYKDREGKITMAPVWDYNLSFGNAYYLRGGATNGWYWTNEVEGITQNEHIWLRRLITGSSSAFATSGDPDFRQKITDRWGELRTGVLSSTNLLGRIDQITNYIWEAQVRDFVRWPRINIEQWPNPNGAQNGTYPPTEGWHVNYATPASYSAVIGDMKKWIGGRYNWIDGQFLKAPVLSRYGGSTTSPINMLAQAGRIYYTVDGSDPRLPGGGISPNARIYSNSVALPLEAQVMARAYLPGTNYMTPWTPWSPPAKAIFGYARPSLSITELMYHPADPPPGTATNAADDFEYIEFANTGTMAIDLTGVHFADGIDFTFPGDPPRQTGAVTTNNFDAVGTPYAAQTLGSGAGAAVQPGGPAGSYLRLLSENTGTNRNRIAFDQTASGSYDRFVADFDFRASNFSIPPSLDVPTLQNFDAPGSTYGLRNWDTAGDPNTPQVMADGGPNGNFVRLTAQVGNDIGGLYFDATEASANSAVIVTFDFRCLGSADGFGFSFLNMANWGLVGTNNVPVPGDAESPGYTGSIGVGFDIYANAASAQEPNGNHVSIHYNGAQVGNGAIPNLSLAAGVFHRAQITIKFEASRALVTVKVSPNIHGAGGATETLFSDLAIAGATAYRGRAAFAARTGGAFANHDIDNVNIQYIASLPQSGGISMQLLPAAVFGTTGGGTTLSNFTDVPAATNILALNFDMHVLTDVNNVNLYWNGVQAGDSFLPVGLLNLDGGAFHHARLEVTRVSSNSLATLVLQPDVHGAGGPALTVFSNLLIRGYSPENARIEFAGRSGGQNLRADIENVNVRFETNGPNLLAAGARLLLVKNRAAFESRYGTGLPVAGEYLGNLDNAGEHLLLLGRYGEPILDFNYHDAWNAITDGSGFSLVMANPTLPANAWNDAANWRASANVGGSPGTLDPAPPGFAPVVINEALSRSEPVAVAGIQDYIELHNAGSNSVNVRYWYLTDDFNRPKKYRITADTVIPVGGHVVFYESAFNSPGNGTNAFALRAEGEEVYVFSGDAAGNLTGWYHGFSFGAADTNVSFGRVVKSTGAEDFVAQTLRTPGTANSGPVIGPVVITEVMYHPPDYPGGVDNQDHEFIELRNISAGPVNLYDPSYPQNTWQLRDAVDFEFPANTTLPAGAYALVVSFDPVLDSNRRASFVGRYGLTGSELLFGPYGGKLDNSTDSVELTKPAAPDPTSGNVDAILVDKVRYHGEPPWPLAADGSGYSLHRIQQAQYGNDLANWAAGPATPSAGYAPGVPPVISQQPVSQTNNLGAPVTFSVAATGPGTLRYQWRFNGLNLPGATNQTYSIPAVAFEQSGDYQVVVLNESGAVESAVASLVGNSIFAIMVQPVSVSLAGSSNVVNFGDTTNGTATFTVGALGNGVMNYQWRFDGVPIPDVNGPTLVITNVNLIHQGSYDVIVSDALGALQSQKAFLAILIRPVIIVAPLSQTNVPLGGTFGVSVVIRGSPPPFYYSWRQGQLEKVKNISNSTNDVFTYGPVGLTNSASNWRIIVTNQALINPLVTDIRLFTVTVQSDYDQDGLPDAWEVANGYSTNDTSNATADLDGDGMTLRQEFIAGTDPADATSVLKIGNVTALGGAGFQFNAVSNHTYSVQFKNDVGLPAWTNLTHLTAVPSNRVMQVFDPAATNQSQRFYRITVPAQP